MRGALPVAARGGSRVSACTDVAVRRGDLVKARARLAAPGAEGLDPKRRQALEQRIAERSAAKGTR